MAELEGAGRGGAKALQLRGLVKRYEGVAAVDGVSLDMEPGEFLALLGPSGCGKTTVLRSIAGIVAPDAGTILLNGTDITTKPIHARDTALVFQNYALFPHLSVFENVAFGLRMRRVERGELRRRVEEALDLVRLPGMASRLPVQLSGGQQQRVALARALVVRPALLLLDEPLSNLDARLREEMRSEIRRVQRALGVATVLVTHDIQEAFAVADRIALMRDGRIEQVGTPAEIYAAPATRFVAGFVGHSNLFEARVAAASPAGARLRLAEGIEVEAAGGALWSPGAAAWLVIRPERIRLGVAASALANRFEAELEDLTYLGSLSHYALRVGALKLTAQAQNETDPELRPGDRVIIGWKPDDCIARLA